MILFSCNKIIIILFFDLCTLYCNMRNFWNVFVINLFFMNTWCSFLNCIHSTSSKRKNCFDFSSMFRFLKNLQSVFFSRIDLCCFFVFDKTLRIRWNDAFLTIYSFFVSCFFLFKSRYLQKLRQTKKSSQLKLFSLLLHDTWILLLSRFLFFLFSFIFWNIES